jgi:hypothetical protein
MIMVCVIRGAWPIPTAGDEKDTLIISALYNPLRRDTQIVIDGERRPFSTLPEKSPPYAIGLGWYTSGAPIPFAGREYVRSGNTVILIPREVERVGVYDGIGIWARRTESSSPGTIFVPIGHGCAFQGYALREAQP